MKGERVPVKGVQQDILIHHPWFAPIYLSIYHIHPSNSPSFLTRLPHLPRALAFTTPPMPPSAFSQLAVGISRPRGFNRCAFPVLFNYLFSSISSPKTIQLWGSKGGARETGGWGRLGGLMYYYFFLFDGVVRDSNSALPLYIYVPH